MTSVVPWQPSVTRADVKSADQCSEPRAIAGSPLSSSQAGPVDPAAFFAAPCFLGFDRPVPLRLGGAVVASTPPRLVDSKPLVSQLTASKRANPAARVSSCAKVNGSRFDSPVLPKSRVICVAENGCESDSSSDAAFLRDAHVEARKFRASSGAMKRTYVEAALASGSATAKDVKCFRDLKSQFEAAKQEASKVSKKCKTKKSKSCKSKGVSSVGSKAPATHPKATGKPSGRASKDPKIGPELLQAVCDCVVEAESVEKEMLDSGKANIP